MSSGSNRFVAMNCQLIGPSRSRSSESPCVANFAIESAAPASSRLFVQKRDALTENTKPSGVSSRQRIQLGGLKLE